MKIPLSPCGIGGILVVSIWETNQRSLCTLVLQTTNEMNVYVIGILCASSFSCVKLLLDLQPLRSSQVQGTQNNEPRGIGDGFAVCAFPKRSGSY